MLLSRTFQVMFGWLSMLLTNIPFLVIRIYVKLGVAEEKEISMMVVKNALFIAQAIREIFHLTLKSKKLATTIAPLNYGMEQTN